MTSRLKRLLKPKVAAVLGMIGPLIAFICIVAAIAVSPWFTWAGNALSDLGDTVLHPASAPIFNTGLIVAGIVTVFFGLGVLMKFKANVTAMVASVILLAADTTLICVGLFPETMPPWHFIFSVTLFVSIALSLLLFGIAFVIEKSTRVLGVLSLILGIVAASPWILMSWEHAAIPEIISVVAVYAWILIMCFVLITGKEVKSKK
nr:DUF998 domain-containing protein [Candidatus Njordarchaeota archaeon]